VTATQPRLADQTVGVIGSGSDEHDDLAREVGVLLAALGVNLLTGGGAGVMRSVSRAYTRAPRTRGICIGILPCRSETERSIPKDGYPNEFVELPIYTHLPYSGERGEDDRSRNHINILSCAAIVALPGSLGTAAEVSLALRYRKPLIAFSRDPRLIANLPAAVPRADSIAAVEQFLRATLRR
jgi:uncharacterized protein (TIGR00725 family)